MPNRGLLAVSERYHFNAMKNMNFYKALEHYKNIESELKNQRLTSRQAMDLKEAETIIRGQKFLDKTRIFKNYLYLLSGINMQCNMPDQVLNH